MLRSLTRCLLGLALAAVALAVAAPVAAGPTRWYPDPPSGTESAPLEAGGRQEDANWVPLRGNHELWCTNGNPGYSGCAGHHGYPAIDIGMPVGTRVFASGPGTVTFAGSAGDARGTFVEIRHPDGIRSRYYHLSAEVVRHDQHVERGTLIGRSGQTGRATSPHLHYEERTAGGAEKDPGVMYAIVAGRLVAYPHFRGYTDWNRTPYGTRIRNDAFNVDNTTLFWGGPGVATGDVDDDGLDDVVVGVPGEDTAGVVDAGGAMVLYGSDNGVVAAGSEQLLAGRDGIAGTMAADEVLGAAVTTGDFDGDGFADVALGAPGAMVGQARAAGEVIVLHGSAAGLLPATRARRLVGTAAEPADQFGAALTTGDFDGDGFDDLVVGAPGETIGGASSAGAITVFAGSASGLRTSGRELQGGTALVVSDAEPGDRLGVAVAAGDVNGDGVDDLAIGAPGEDTQDTHGVAEPDAGALLVLLGRPATVTRPGLRGHGSRELHLDAPGVAGDGRRADQLGTTVAVGQLDEDEFADVAAGAVGKDVGGAEGAGSLLVVHGSATGLRPGDSRHLHADQPHVAGAAQAGDHLGSGLAIGDVDGDEQDDLVAGIAGQDVGTAAAAGAVLVLLGRTGGVTGEGSRQVHSGTGSTGLADAAETGDVLGSSVAVGDLDADGQADLAVGVPGEDVAGSRDAGTLVLAYAAASAAFHGDTPAVIADGERGDRWGGLFPIYLR